MSEEILKQLKSAQTALQDLQSTTPIASDKRPRLEQAQQALALAEREVSAVQGSLLVPKRKLHIAHAFGRMTPNPKDRSGNPWPDRWWWKKTAEGRVKYAGREPYMGEYNLADPKVILEYVEECARGRIDALSCCTFYNGKDHIFEENTLIEGLKRCDHPGKPKHYMALEFRGSYKPLTKLDDLKHLIKLMVKEFQDPGYLRVDFERPNRPVVSILHMEWVIETLLPALGLTLAQVLDMMTWMSAEDIYFIANCETSPHWVAEAWKQGFHGISAYNYMRPYLDRGKSEPKAGPLFKTMEEAYEGYSDAWEYLIRKFPGDVWLPTLVGFDSVNAHEHQIGDSTPDQFRAHLAESRVLCDTHDKVKATVCDAVDEHWEGSVLMATLDMGRSRMADHAEAYA